MIELLKQSSLRILVAAAVPCLWLPAGAVAAQASPVTLSRAPSVSENDYPARAIRAEVQGSVVVVIAVDPTGAATGCTPIEIDSPGFGLEDAEVVHEDLDVGVLLHQRLGVGWRAEVPREAEHVVAGRGLDAGHGGID
jgi:hypothetical protein